MLEDFLSKFDETAKFDYFYGVDFIQTGKRNLENMGGIKSLFENGIISLALLPEKNDFLLSDEGKQARRDLTARNDPEEIKQYHENSKENLKFLDLKKLNLKERIILTPIDHDYTGRTPLMNNSVFEHYGVNNAVSLFVVANPLNVKLIFDSFKEDPKYIGGGAGSGFKEIVLQYLYEVSDTARDLGSANLIVNENKKLIGYNTDGLGFRIGLEKDLEKTGKNIKGKKVVILGSGATLVPIAYELKNLNPKEIVILNRSVERAETASIRLNKIVRSGYAKSGGEDKIGEELRDAELVINVSQKGTGQLKNYSAFSPASTDKTGKPIKEKYEAEMQIARNNLSNLPKTAIVADVLLEDNPKTLQMARSSGYATHHGKYMNLYQGIPWYGKLGFNFPEDELEKIIIKILFKD